jgi:hypothetical protein
MIDYLPVYYQGSKGASPVKSGIDLFGIAFTVVRAPPFFPALLDAHTDCDDVI